MRAPFIAANMRKPGVCLVHQTAGRPICQRKCNYEMCMPDLWDSLILKFENCLKKSYRREKEAGMRRQNRWSWGKCLLWSLCWSGNSGLKGFVRAECSLLQQTRSKSLNCDLRHHEDICWLPEAVDYRGTSTQGRRGFRHHMIKIPKGQLHQSAEHLRKYWKSVHRSKRDVGRHHMVAGHGTLSAGGEQLPPCYSSVKRLKWCAVFMRPPVFKGHADGAQHLNVKCLELLQKILWRQAGSRADACQSSILRYLDLLLCHGDGTAYLNENIQQRYRCCEMHGQIAFRENSENTDMTIPPPHLWQHKLPAGVAIVMSEKASQKCCEPPQVAQGLRRW